MLVNRLFDTSQYVPGQSARHPCLPDDSRNIQWLKTLTRFYVDPLPVNVSILLIFVRMGILSVWNELYHRQPLIEHHLHNQSEDLPGTERR